MLDAALDLRRTSHAVRAIPSSFAFVLHQSGTAFRTFCDELNRFAVGFTFLEVDADNFRDYLATFFNFYSIFVMQIKLFYEIGVVEGLQQEYRS